MRAFIRGLSPVAEFAIVVAIAFGLWLWQGLATVTLRFSSTEHLKWPPLTDAAVLGLLLVEGIVLTVVSVVGRMRGWSFRDFGVQLSWKLTAWGIGLVFLIHLPASVLLRESFSVFSGSVSIFVLVPFLVINAFFEESLEVGYVFHSLSRYGFWPPVIASAILRSSLHLYLGGVAFLAVLMGGIFYALIYAKLRQLWPLAVAHFVMGLVFLWPLLRLS